MTVLVWIYGINLSGVIYEMIPGFLVCTVVSIVVSMMTKVPEGPVTAHFDEMMSQIKAEKSAG